MSNIGREFFSQPIQIGKEKTTLDDIGKTLSGKGLSLGNRIVNILTGKSTTPEKLFRAAIQINDSEAAKALNNIFRVLNTKDSVAIKRFIKDNPKLGQTLINIARAIQEKGTPGSQLFQSAQTFLSHVTNINRLEAFRPTSSEGLKQPSLPASTEGPRASYEIEQSRNEVAVAVKKAVEDRSTSKEDIEGLIVRISGANIDPKQKISLLNSLEAKVNFLPNQVKDELNAAIRQAKFDTIPQSALKDSFARVDGSNIDQFLGEIIADHTTDFLTKSALMEALNQKAQTLTLPDEIKDKIKNTGHLLKAINELRTTEESFSTQTENVLTRFHALRSEAEAKGDTKLVEFYDKQITNLVTILESSANLKEALWNATTLSDIKTIFEGETIVNHLDALAEYSLTFDEVGTIVPTIKNELLEGAFQRDRIGAVQRGPRFPLLIKEINTLTGKLNQAKIEGGNIDQRLTLLNERKAEMETEQNKVKTPSEFLARYTPAGAEAVNPSHIPSVLKQFRTFLKGKPMPGGYLGAAKDTTLQRNADFAALESMITNQYKGKIPRKVRNELIAIQREFLLPFKFKDLAAARKRLQTVTKNRLETRTPFSEDEINDAKEIFEKLKQNPPGIRNDTRYKEEMHQAYARAFYIIPEKS